MPLNSDALHEIDGLVRGGFEKRDRIIEILCEEMYAPGELDEAEVIAAVDAALAAHARDKTTWPVTTDCDRLDSVFAALNAQGIIALQNAGLTQSDGYYDVRQSYNERADRDTVIGYCFYHGQDLEGAVRGEGLYLAFGPIDAKKRRDRRAAHRGHDRRGACARGICRHVEQHIQPAHLDSGNRLEASMTLRHLGGFLFGRQPSLGRELIHEFRQMLAQA